MHMGTLRNSYDYAKRQRTATRDYRCVACGGLIYQGEAYEATWHGKEHVDNCPDDPAERQRRDCK